MAASIWMWPFTMKSMSLRTSPQTGVAISCYDGDYRNNLINPVPFSMLLPTGQGRKYSWGHR